MAGLRPTRPDSLEKLRVLDLKLLELPRGLQRGNGQCGYGAQRVAVLREVASLRRREFRHNRACHGSTTRQGDRDPSPALVYNQALREYL